MNENPEQVFNTVLPEEEHAEVGESAAAEMAEGDVVADAENREPKQTPEPVASSEKKEALPTVSRRGFLKGLGAVVVGSVVAGAAHKAEAQQDEDPMKGDKSLDAIQPLMPIMDDMDKFLEAVQIPKGMKLYVHDEMSGHREKYLHMKEKGGKVHHGDKFLEEVKDFKKSIRRGKLMWNAADDLKNPEKFKEELTDWMFFREVNKALNGEGAKVNVGFMYRRTRDGNTLKYSEVPLLDAAIAEIDKADVSKITEPIFKKLTETYEFPITREQLEQKIRQKLKVDRNTLALRRNMLGGKSNNKK